eukprot:CAMPEP_0176273712 /NCGR_PEP_ID=MMETSP0121_2-20121125/46359_1 /TAXON_ID=160619 /ORGANISM="Kryptoperidinium foliaceum, Strain CCMP 1326" /LENGTH=72 /DNA_ID=CAMNT_0017613901 /DNA_START=91 /DNA_END=306 /DNA_ORIENTATION=-
MMEAFSGHTRTPSDPRLPCGADPLRRASYSGVGHREAELMFALVLKKDLRTRHVAPEVESLSRSSAIVLKLA